MKVVFSNHIEQLLARLAETIREPLPGTGFLAPEYVLIDNKVMGQWLNLQLAEAHGVAANIEYVQPSGLFWKLAKWLLADTLPQQTPLQKVEMKWKLFTLLGDEELLAEAVMQPVRNYLEDRDCHELKRYQLAAGIADLFDQYLIYRPQWLLTWQQGKQVAELGYADKKTATRAQAACWQSLLWQRLTAADERIWHRAAIEERLLEIFHNGAQCGQLGRMPVKRLFVFGISSFSPSMLKLLDGVGRHIDVTFHVLNPCREYWGLVASAKRQARLADGGEGLYHEIGNPLLASQGVQLQEFIELLQECSSEDEYLESGAAPATLLHAIQQEILRLEYRGESAREIDYVSSGEKRQVPVADLDVSNRIPSLHIHQCHSAQREVEVLHDQVRDMLARNPQWNPRDIVVMMPRVADYVPYIHAVFNAVGERHRIPYHITDRAVVEESPLLNSFVSLLAIADSRLPLSEVLALLEVPAVQARFGLDQQGFDKLRSWLVKSGARWGVDGEHRQALGLPAYDEYSWQFALDRLLAGYALAVEDELCSDDLVVTQRGYAVMPLDEIEGSSDALLDAFLQFWHKLQAFRESVKTPRTAMCWHDDLMQLLQDFYEASEEDDLRALGLLRAAIAELKDAQERKWCDTTLGIAVIRDMLKPALQQNAQGRHSWQEGIKFCSLLPMRAVPFRVVYVMGMNQADYPRQVERRSFDLMRNHRRPGDRASRIDDRWLFLEALLSAREVFHVSYVARDMHRNEKREPSVVLSELIDYLENGYQWPADSKRESWLFTRHPLQPFSPAYFAAGEDRPHRCFSFDSHAYAIAAARPLSGQQSAATNVPAQRWQKGQQQESEIIEIGLDEFIRFFTKPWQWLLSNRFGLQLDVEDDGVDDDEPYAVAAGLESWQLYNELLEKVNGQPAGQEGFARLVHEYVTVRKARAGWPLGQAGSVLQQELEAAAGFFYASHGRPVTLRPCEYRCKAGGVELLVRGQLPVHVAPGAAAARLLLHTPGKVKNSSRLLELLIRFAIASLAGAQDGHPPVESAESIYLDGRVEITPALAGQLRLADFMRTLATLCLDYRGCGLPFDIGIAGEIADIAAAASDDVLESESSIEEALYEMLDHYWFGDERNGGAAGDIWKATYFGSRAAIADEQFVQTCCLIQGFLDEFRQQLDDANTAARKGRGKS